MKMKTDINGLWRFYDEANNIGGITIGEDDDRARNNAMKYIKKYFKNIIRKTPDIRVWKIEDDGDYHCNDTIAIAYFWRIEVIKQED